MGCNNQMKKVFIIFKGSVNYSIRRYATYCNDTQCGTKLLHFPDKGTHTIFMPHPSVSVDEKLITHFEPSELTEPSLESFELCLVNLGLFAGITSVLRCTPLDSDLLPPRSKPKNRATGVQ